ncbi:DUF3794 domain-containing protein [Natroniella acetigena]|uniref:DUF3794 domain-containing protein n=1 Tax=Natroniella acetigena TaxID=52004 RepID=UPI00200AA5B5|nr:DUF3794 domain-containing protein [Natroniella acetigena]MCK8826729.1 DUF3794 domain-containing protein [Natroniella acetigena]
MEDFNEKDKLYELVTIEEDLKCLPSNAVCKEIIKEKSLVIPKAKPDIEQLAKILIRPSISSHKIIKTPQGPKVIIKGKITQKIFYVANKPEQTVHAAKFTFPFCTFIRLPKRVKIEDIKIKIEDVIVQLTTKRKINKCVLLFLAVIPKKRCSSPC